MSANTRLFTKAVYGFDAVVRRADRDRWGNPSPCEGWSARDVVSHVAMACAMISGMACGEPAIVEGSDGRPAPGPDGYVMRPALAEMMETPIITADDDPVAVWGTFRDEVLEAMDESTVMDEESMGTFGPITPTAFVVPVGFDIVIHEWDLSMALAVEVCIDPELASMALAGFRMGEEAGSAIRQPAVMADQVSTESADPVSRLVAFAGRDPAWGG